MAQPIDATDPVGAAERVTAGEGSTPSSPKRGRGRPRGSKTKRPSTARPKADEEELEEEREPYKASEASVQGAALLGATLWRIAGPMVKLDALTEDEALELGQALDPILYKYVPMVSEWREELNALVVIVGLFGATRARYVAEHPPRPSNGVRDVAHTEVP